MGTGADKKTPGEHPRQLPEPYLSSTKPGPSDYLLTKVSNLKQRRKEFMA